MNTMHRPAGSPQGGQFASHNGICIRNLNSDMDMNKYYREIRAEDDPKKKEKLIKSALYNGGYLLSENDEVNLNNMSDFISDLNREHFCTNSWLNHKDLVENYVSTFKGYLASNNFDLVTNGHYSSDYRERITDDFTSEFGLTKSDVGELLKNNLEADDFIASGRNNSSYEANKGTVVMEFSPRVELQKESMTPNGLKHRKVTVDLYVKTVLNPHPDVSRGQTPMQILSIKEANSKVQVFTSKERKSREEWKRDRRNPDNPQREKRLKDEQ